MKTYKKPVMNVEHFVPNEFVAACGDSGTVYKFQCDAGELGFTLSYVYQETNNKPGLQTIGRNRDTLLGTYQACGTTHEAESNSGFHEGYMVDIDTIWDHPVDVIIWRGEDGHNIHCTTNLDMKTWETAKS